MCCAIDRDKNRTETLQFAQFKRAQALEIGIRLLGLALCDARRGSGHLAADRRVYRFERIDNKLAPLEPGLVGQLLSSAIIGAIINVNDADNHALARPQLVSD